MKKKPKQYRVRNWSKYNAGLKQRGSITFWLDEAALTQWLNKEKTGKRGAGNTYNDVAIETAATIKSVYSLGGRQAVSFVESVFELMRVEQAVFTELFLEVSRELETERVVFGGVNRVVCPLR